MCLRLILPYSEHYEDRLHDLNMSELTVYLDLICLRYVEKVRQHQSHPLSEHVPKPTTGKYHRQLARPKHRTSLLGHNLFYKYFWFFILITWPLFLYFAYNYFSLILIKCVNQNALAGY